MRPVREESFCPPCRDVKVLLNTEGEVAQLSSADSSNSLSAGGRWGIVTANLQGAFFYARAAHSQS